MHTFKQVLTVAALGLLAVVCLAPTAQAGHRRAASCPNGNCPGSGYAVTGYAPLTVQQPVVGTAPTGSAVGSMPQPVYNYGQRSYTAPAMTGINPTSSPAVYYSSGYNRGMRPANPGNPFPVQQVYGNSYGLGGTGYRPFGQVYSGMGSGAGWGYGIPSR